ncbi:hypothetical protein V1524DRAFT_398738 [Lipomyces starkeyi]
MVAISYISLGLVAISTAVVAVPSAIDVDNKFFSHIHTHAKHSVGHSHSPHHHAHNHSKRSTTCSFPSSDGLVEVTPGSTNGGWALSPDTACTAGSWCPYACPSGQLMAQWDPSATSYTYPQSQYGGLYCDDNGDVSKPFSDKPYCYDGTGTVSAVSSAGNIAFCQTVLPGNEAMLIPTEVTSSSTTLAVPDSSYWAGTAAHYYINPPGVSTDDGCVWGSTSNPWGNWSPYVAGANTDSTGTTFVKLGWNPVYLEDSSPYQNTLPSWGVNITCPDGGCTGLPCGIDPSVHGVNQCYNQATGAGGGNFCVVGVQSGKSATLEVFSSGSSSSSSNAKVAAAVNDASSPSSSSEYSSSVAASTSTVELTASSASPASTTSTSSTSSTSSSSSTTSTSSNSSISSTSSTSSTSSDTSSSSSAYVEPTVSAVYTSGEPLTSSTEVSSTEVSSTEVSSTEVLSTVSSTVNTDTLSEVLPTSTEVPVSSSTADYLSSTEVTVESSSTEVAMTSTSIPVSSTSLAPSASSSFAAWSAEASSVSAIVSSLSETTIGEPTTSSDAPSSTSVIVVTTTVVPSSTIAFNYSSTPTYTSNNGTFAVSPSSTATLTSLSSSIQPTNGTTLLLSTTTTTTTPTASSSTFNPVSTISTVSRGAQYLNLDQSSTTSSTLTSSSTAPTQSASSNSDSNKSSGNVSAGMTLHTPGTVCIAAVVLGAVMVLA